MKQSIRMLLLAVVILFTRYAWAGDHFYPSRVRLLAHGGLELGEGLELRTHFIPASNLMSGLAPLSYLGLGWKPTGSLDIEPVAGWSFGSDEPILSVRLAPKLDRLYGWSDIELQLPSKDGYWFAQVNYQVLKWLHAGVEGEGWGNFQHGEWSHGGGPNLILVFGKVGLDLTLHTRKLGEEIKPEFFLRFHLFL